MIDREGHGVGPLSLPGVVPPLSHSNSDMTLTSPECQHLSTVKQDDMFPDHLSTGETKRPEDYEQCDESRHVITKLLI
jgi:hypothetical protein